MAASQQGYKCEFIDSVPEDFYCKKCILVARRLVYTSCCEETYCHRFITDIQQQNKPCPACGKEEFSIVELKKYQKKVMQLQVYCSMKERGCVWSRTLDQLDTHLDPHLDNCQYVDTKCPLTCLQTIPKNKVEQHVAQECTKRPHVCQHCGFKATYEEVVDTHLPECKYVALQCPNRCGVSCEREVMEDHMKMCRLEEVECEFSSVGCDSRYNREDQDEHARQNSQKHLTLTASLAAENNKHLQKKLVEQDKKHEEEEEKLKIKLETQEKKLVEHAKKLEKQEKRLGEQENKLREQEKKLGAQEKKLGEQEKKLGEQEKKLGAQEKKLGEQEKKLGAQEKKLGEQEKKLGEQEKKLGAQEKKLGEQEKKLGAQEKKLGEQEKKLGAQEKKLGAQEKKLGEQEKKLGEQEKKLGEQEKKLGEQEKKLGEQEKKLGAQEKKLGEQEKKLGAQEKKLGEQEKKLGEQEKNLKEQKKMISQCTSVLCLNRNFVMENFSKLKAKDKPNEWKSPVMYTHMHGYKFCIGVDANGFGSGRGKAVYVDFWPMLGEFDDNLKWPVKAQFTIKLINNQIGENATCIETLTWNNGEWICSQFKRISNGFIEHSQLNRFLVDDALTFHISAIKIL